MPLHLVREPAMPWRQRTMHRPNEILMGQTQNMDKAELVGNSWIIMDYPQILYIYMYIYLHISVHMYPFGFIHMLPPHILVSCQVGQYLPKAMLAQNWIPQHWIQLHCFCNLVCHKPQKSLMLSAVLDPEHSLGTLSEFGDLVPVVSTRKISVISPQLWTDHDGS